MVKGKVIIETVERGKNLGVKVSTELKNLDFMGKMMLMHAMHIALEMDVAEDYAFARMMELKLLDGNSDVYRGQEAEAVLQNCKSGGKFS